MSLDIKFFPLTFITENEQVLRQLRNTVLFSYLSERNRETTLEYYLEYYLESTQYGYTASAIEQGNHRLLRITDITNGKVDWKTVPYCNCDSEAKYLLAENDILVARTGGTTGKSFVVTNPPGNAVFASYLIRLRLKSGVDPEFIERFLNSYAFWTQIVEMKSGTAMPNVNAEKLKTLKLPECNLETQKKVSELFNQKGNDASYNSLFDKLGSIERLFTNNALLSTELNKHLDLVKQLRQAFLREAMQGKLVPQDPKDEPASELLKRIKAEKEQLLREKKIKKEKELPPIKEEEIPFEVPRGWVWGRLGEIASNIEYGTSQKAEMASNHIPVLRMNNIQNAQVDCSNLKYVSAGIDDLPKLYLKDGDLLFNRTNSYELVGKSGVYHGENDVMTFASYLIRVQFTNLAFADFINSWINSTFCRTTQLEPEIIQQNGQANFNGTKLKNILCPIPPLSEQSRIMNKLECIRLSCNELEENTKRSQTQNGQLLQQVLREALNPN